jgi:hypothetical protein
MAELVQFSKPVVFRASPLRAPIPIDFKLKSDILDEGIFVPEASNFLREGESGISFQEALARLEKRSRKPAGYRQLEAVLKENHGILPIYNSAALIALGTVCFDEVGQERVPALVKDLSRHWVLTWIRTSAGFGGQDCLDIALTLRQEV